MKLIPNPYLSESAIMRFKVATRMQCARVLFVTLVLTVQSLNVAVAQKADRKEKEAKRVAELIAGLQGKHPFRNTHELCSNIKELSEIGDAAVLPLIDALEKTNDDWSMRAYGFTLRVINDPRAVPALIRAIPRTLRKPGSDYGCRLVDEELLAFMQKHDNSKNDRPGSFSYNRPVREITKAIQRITKTDQGDDAITGVFLTGGKIERFHQQKQCHDLAKRWENWWQKNWRKHVMNPMYSKVGLKPFGKMQPTVRRKENPIPYGDKITIGGARSGWILEPIQKSKHTCLLDLETMKRGKTPEEIFPKGTMDYQLKLREKAKEFAEFAKREGFDLMGIKVALPGTKKEVYAIKPLGARVWRVDDSVWNSIGDDVKKDAPLKLGARVEDYLMARDEKSGDYLPNKKAVFVFQTREGSTGIIRIISQVDELLTFADLPLPEGPKPNQGFSLGVKIEMKQIYESIEPEK